MEAQARAASRDALVSRNYALSMHKLRITMRRACINLNPSKLWEKLLFALIRAARK